MKKIPSTVLALLCVLAALWLASYCGERRGRQEAEAAQRDRGDNATAVRIAAHDDSVSRVYDADTAALHRQIRRYEAAIRPLVQLPDSVSVLREQIAARDLLLDVYRHGAPRLEEHVTLRVGTIHVYRDTLVKNLTAARDSYRAASRKRLGCALGPSITAGFSGRVVYGIGVSCGLSLRG